MMRPSVSGPQAWVSHEHTLSRDRAARSYAVRMPAGQFFSHVTAASLWGIPLPHYGTGDPIHISVLSPQPRPRANRVVGHELDSRVTTVVALDGMPISDPVSTWCQLAGVLALPDLVAAADYLMMPDGEQPPVLDLDALGDAADQRKGHRGAGQLRDALALARVGSCSRIETLVRVLLHEAGLPEPALQQRLTSDESQPGAVLPIVYPDYAVAIDVVTESERARHTRSLEIHRAAELDELGWKMVVFSDADVHPSNPLATRDRLAEVSAMLQDRGWTACSAAA